MTAPGGAPTLRVYRGLPGSGKSTDAERWVAERPEGRARVNRDSLRAMLHDGRFIPADRDAGTPGTEVQVVAVRDAAIVALLRAGISVACDDTNLTDQVVERLCEIAVQHGAVPVVFDLLGVPVETCIARDAARGLAGGRSVGADVIRGMFADYLAQARPDRDQP